MKTNLLLILFTSFSLMTYSQESETIVENFDNNDRNWTVGSNTSMSASISGGEYLIKNPTEKYLQTFGTEIAIDPNADFSIETKIMLTSGSEAHGYGLIFGYYNWENYATAQISATGYFKLDYSLEDETTELIPAFLVKENQINPIKQWNIIKLDKSGNELKISINGTLVKSINAPCKFTGQSFGFLLSNGQEAKVDYVKITRKKLTLDLVEFPTVGKELENLGPNVNSKYSELNPLISVDGKTIYYAIKNNPDLNIGEKLFLNAAYSSKDESNTWTKTKLIEGPVNNANHNYMISVSPDDNSALFGNTYDEDGGSSNGVSYGIKRNGEWQKPEAMTIKNFRNKSSYTEYCLSPDGLTILIAFESDDSFGGRDIYVSFLNEDDTWTEPKNCGNQINTYGIEMTPFLAADGKTLFFSSYGHPGYGSSDVFISKRLDDTWTNWSKPKNVGNVINSENFDAYFKIDAQGVYGYMVTSNNSIGNEDIFRIKIGEGLKPDVLNLISGKVYNAKTKELIEAEVEYEDLSVGKKLGIAYSTKENGFKIALPKGTNYGFRASADGFISVANNIDLSNISAYEEKEVNLYLVPIESGQSLTLNNLFFDSGKSILKKESFSELNRLVKVMNENASMKIEISGHTDSDGEEQTNMVLSQDRAKAVYTFLIDKGIASTRMTSIGFGESKPKAPNTTPEGKKSNRRVELKIQ